VIDVRPREATEVDLKALEGLETRCFGEHGFDRATLFMLLTVQDFRTIVVETGDEIIGYASVFVGRGTSAWRLVSVAVDPKWRERGVGTLLIRRVIDLMRVEGQSELLLEVRVTNVPAINLYLKLGFEIEGVIKGYYGDGEDALSMLLRLSEVKCYRPSGPLKEGEHGPERREDCTDSRIRQGGGPPDRG